MISNEILKNEIEKKAQELVQLHYKIQREILGIMLYGSRVTNTSRPNSDFDVMVVFESKDSQEEMFLEFFGSIEIGDTKYPVELRCFDKKYIEKEIESGLPLRSHAIAHGVILMERNGEMLHFVAIAKARIKKEIRHLQQAISKICRADLISEFRITYTQALEILTDPEYAGGATAIYARLMEYLLDYYIYLQYFQDPNAHAYNEWEQLVLLKGNRGARFLNAKKYEVQPWFKSLLQCIDSILEDDQLKNIREKVLAIFELLDDSFQSITGQPLLLQSGEFCEAVFK